MKVVFVQLPLQEPGAEGAKASIPLLAGNLASYALSRGVLSRDEALILGRAVSDSGSDSAIAEAIAAAGADLACFCLFDWNLERSLYIASRAAQAQPRLRLAACGPEVAQGMGIMTRSPFHALIEGESEEGFRELAEDLRKGRPPARRYAARAPLDLSLLPNPYLAGLLSFEADRPAYIETARGASARGGYRGLAPEGGAPRYFPEDQVLKAVEAAGKAGVRDLFLSGPPRGAECHSAETLVGLAKANAAGLSLHAEMRMESVTDEAARLYAAAGLAFADAELLSVNPKALEAVGRSQDRAAFERGVEALQKARVGVKARVLVGLPFDGYEQVIETFDFLGMHGLGQEADLAPLALLPGTEARKMADDWGMSRMDKPPYWVTSTDWISGDDMADAVAAFEDGFDVEWAFPPSPRFREEEDGFRAFVDARRGEGLDWMRLNPGRLASSVTVLADADDPEGLSRLVRAARDLKRDNPFTLYQIVLRSDSRFPSEKLAARIREAFVKEDHYYELSRFFSLDPQPSYQARLFFATRNPSLAYRAMEEAQDMETMLVLTGKGGFNADRLAEQLPFVAFDRESMPFDRLYELMSVYADYRHMLVEAPEELFA